MPSKISQKALKDGLITKKQYDKLPAHLLDKVAAHKIAMKKKETKKKKKKSKK